MKPDASANKNLARLWEEYKEQESREAKDEIVIHYLDLVRFIAGRMAMNAPPQVEKDDLIGWGVIGLLDAVEKFDPGQKVSFETYATTRIRGSVIDQIRSLDWAPRSLRRKGRELNLASTRLKEKLGREPTESELADEMQISDNELFELRTGIHGAYMLSLDARINDDPETGETTLAEVTGDATSPSPEESVSRREMEEKLAAAIEKLPTNERQVITLYYYDELTLKEIGKALALSESRICQIHRAVTRKLRGILGASLKDAAY